MTTSSITPDRLNDGSNGHKAGKDRSAAEARRRIIEKSLTKRHGRENLFRRLGLTAVSLGLLFVALLFVSILWRGLPAFWQSAIPVNVYFDPAIVQVPARPVQMANETPADFKKRDLAWQGQLGLVDWDALIVNSLVAKNPKIAPELKDPTKLAALNQQMADNPDAFTEESLAANPALASQVKASEIADSKRASLISLFENGEGYRLRDLVKNDPTLIGKSQNVSLWAAANVDVWLSGNIDRSLPDEQQQLSPEVRQIADQLKAEGVIQNKFNTPLFLNPDSRNAPATSGLAGAFVGTLYMMLIVLIFTIPVGVAGAVYLEEFAPRNRLTDLIEVNINNLAAVPSIIFGLLGAAIFISAFDLPRSAPLVGGLVLSLLTLPTVIIATRASLRAVPPSIRQAALGLGASKMQSVFHHVLPLAIPGILTGVIIGLAHALGETAPLLLIGMKAFVASVPHSPLEPSTALPVQVYLWQGNELRNFFEARTAAAIIVLLALLISLNGLAIWLRKKFEVRW